MNKDDSYKTSIGGVSSVIIIIIVAVFFQSNVIQFLYKTQIMTDISTVFSTDPD